MPTKQGDLILLNDPIAQELLHSTIPARLAYVWRDGTPRAIPIWFHWNGQEVVISSPMQAPKMKVLQQNSKVALTIDTSAPPYRVLQIRGTITIETVDGVVPEYALAAKHYLGEEQGQAWVEQARKLFPQMARIRMRPEWVAIFDFETRTTSAIEAARSG